MHKPLNVVAVSGGLQRPSRTLALTEQLLATLADKVSTKTHLIELGEIGPRLAGALHRSQLPADIEAQIQIIESADLLVVASPVYRGSFSGLFKHLFDFVHHESLINVPVLLAATGGSHRHALVIEHQLRPLFGFFQTHTLPLGVYAIEQDFRDYTIVSPDLQARIELAVSRAIPWVHAGRSHRVQARDRTLAA